MKHQKTKSGHASSIPRGLAIGALTSIVITLLAAVLLAKLIDQQWMSWENVGYGILVTILVASFAGAWLAYHKIRHQRLAVCLMSGLLYWSILICIGALLYSGEFQGVFVASGIVLAGSISAFLLTAPRNSHKHGRKYRIAHR